MGNIEVRGIFTASVLHNYFKNKSEEIYKRGLQGITPRIFLDICEEFLSRCAYKSLHLEKSDFYECLENKYAIFMPYSEELLRLYESEMIFHFDEENFLLVRHMKFFEYLYADYMIQRTNSLKEWLWAVLRERRGKEAMMICAADSFILIFFFFFLFFRSFFLLLLEPLIFWKSWISGCFRKRGHDDMRS